MLVISRSGPCPSTLSPSTSRFQLVKAGGGLRCAGVEFYSGGVGTMASSPRMEIKDLGQLICAALQCGSFLKPPARDGSPDTKARRPKALPSLGDQNPKMQLPGAVFRKCSPGGWPALGLICSGEWEQTEIWVSRSGYVTYSRFSSMQCRALVLWRTQGETESWPLRGRADAWGGEVAHPMPGHLHKVRRTGPNVLLAQLYHLGRSRTGEGRQGLLVVLMDRGLCQGPKRIKITLGRPALQEGSLRASETGVRLEQW